MKTIKSPRAGAFDVPCFDMTVFDYLYNRVLGGPLWTGRAADVTSAREALDALHDDPSTNVDVSDSQYALLVEILKSTTDFARYGSLSIAIMEAT